MGFPMGNKGAEVGKDSSIHNKYSQTASEKSYAMVWALASSVREGNHSLENLT